MTKNDLLETLEALRSSKHPELDPKLVQEVVSAQSEFMANPNEAFKSISQAIESYLTYKEVNSAHPSESKS